VSPLTGPRMWLNGLVVVLVVLGALGTHHQLDRWYEGGVQPPPPQEGNGENGELPGPVTPPGDEDPGETGPPSLPDGPKLAIIIDDLGWDGEGTEAILGLPYPLTMAVLPDGPTTRSDVKGALEHEHEVILHLPMEPLGGYTGKPQVVATGMEDEEINELVKRYLAQMPEAVGVNNHMGSKATADRRVAQRVLRIVKERELFFVDSRTWRGSVMCEVAAELELPCTYNQLFLDNQRDVEAIVERLEEAAALAREEGQAVVIGHVYSETAAALEKTLPKLVDEGIHLVLVSQLVGGENG